MLAAIRRAADAVLFMLLTVTSVFAADEPPVTVATVFERIRQHEFHPLNAEGTFTIDRQLKVPGVADLNNRDGRVRLLAIRDLVRLLPAAAVEVEAGLRDPNRHVRQISAAALGIRRHSAAAEVLAEVLQHDDSPLVRSQAALSLGEMDAANALEELTSAAKNDGSRDVRHCCERAIHRIRTKQGATPELLRAHLELRPENFGRIKAGEQAEEFVLNDISGKAWSLRDANLDRWVVLIWIFADWCPVCHGEFRDLIAARQKFDEAGISVATIECHDVYRSRVMVGWELDPQYWFAKQSFQQTYRTGIWWSHLTDPAGAVGAIYGVEPLTFAVHGEFVNRPSTIIIDPKGKVRFAYYGTFWGDRPTISQTLEMIRTERFDFEHRDRRKLSAQP
jgi:peroxiredoxin